MASLCCHPNWLRIYVTVIIFFCFMPSSSVALSAEVAKEMKMRLGSRPPRCVNRCFGCRPCMAVLVTAPHPKAKGGYKVAVDRGDESYYLLSWKCKCGDRYFQP